ncbi:hypothetical protein BBJ28_00020903, partial [Nothophytophthora sp. Chile5]
EDEFKAITKQVAPDVIQALITTVPSLEEAEWKTIFMADVHQDNHHIMTPVTQSDTFAKVRQKVLQNARLYNSNFVIRDASPFYLKIRPGGPKQNHRRDFVNLQTAKKDDNEISEIAIVALRGTTRAVKYHWNRRYANCEEEELVYMQPGGIRIIRGRFDSQMGEL